MFKKGIFILMLLLLGLPQITFAQVTEVANPLEFRLDQITVFGDKEPEMTRTASVNNIVIGEEIVDMTPGDNLADLLQSQGFAVIPAGNADGNTFLVIRGFRSDHLGKEIDGRVLIMIDGRRSGASDLATISLLNIERVEVLRGPEMLQYSAAFSGGIINVVTKRPKGEVPMSGTVELGMGTDGYYKGQVAVNGATSGFDYSMGYRYTEMGDFHDANGDKVNYSNTEHMNSFSANVGYTFLENHRIGVNTFYYKVEGAHKPAMIDQFGDYSAANYSDKENWFINFSYDGQTTSGDWTWDLSYSFGENSVLSYAANASDPLNRPPFGHYYDTQTAQGRLAYHGGMYDISGGLQWTEYAVDLTERVVGGGRSPSSTTTNYGAYLMGRLFLFDDSLILSSALRYDYYNVSDDAKSLGIRKQATKHNTTFEGLSPSFGVAYLPLNWLKLRANYTRGFRAPSGRELVEDRQYNFWGNPENTAERSDNYEAGFDILGKGFSVSATYFYSYTRDFIYQHTDPAYAQRKVQNSDKQIRDGLELYAAVDIAQLAGWDGFVLRPSLSYNYMFRNKEKYRSYSSWEDNTMQEVPKYSMAAGLYFRHIPSDFSANLSVSYFGQYGSRQQSYYTMVNLGAEKRILQFGDYGQLNLRAEIRNMLDERYCGSVNRTISSTGAVSGYYMPGRSFYLGAIYKF